MVEKKTGWEESKKKKVKEALDISFMSSDEEFESDGETFFKIQPLPWRSEAYNGIIKELDQKHSNNLTPRARRQIVKRVQGKTESSRSRPENVLPSNDWVLK